MKSGNMIFIQRALRFYLLISVLFFGAGILVKHYLFQVEITHEVITDNLFVSLLTSVLFTFAYRSKWVGTDKSFLFMSNEEKA